MNISQKMKKIDDKSSDVPKLIGFAFVFFLAAMALGLFTMTAREVIPFLLNKFFGIPISDGEIYFVIGILMMGPLLGGGIAIRIKTNRKKRMKKLTELLKREPKNSNLYLERGKLYHILKKYNEALEDFSKGIELNPNQSELYVERGFTYDSLKQFESSRKDFQKAVELNTSDLMVREIVGEPPSQRRQKE